jgi:hypothetical protein
MESKQALFERSFAKDVAAADPGGGYTPAAARFPTRSAAGRFAFHAAAPQLSQYNPAQYVPSTVTPPGGGGQRERKRDGLRAPTTPLPKRAASKILDGGEIDDAAHAKERRAARLPSPVHRGYDEKTRGGADAAGSPLHQRAQGRDSDDVSPAFAPARSPSPIPLLGASPKANGGPTPWHAGDPRSDAKPVTERVAPEAPLSAAQRVAPMAAPGGVRLESPFDAAMNAAVVRLLCTRSMRARSRGVPTLPRKRVSRRRCCAMLTPAPPAPPAIAASRGVD